MKVQCLYIVVDILTGDELASGRKFKDFENSPIRYIKDIYERREFPCFWRKLPCYYRTVEIKGRQCLIYYWTERRKYELCNYALPFKNRFFLSGRNYRFDPHNEIELVKELGVI